MTYEPILTAAERSPKAHERMRELIAENNKDLLELARDFTLTDTDNSWASMTELEAAIFGIDPRLVTAMAWAEIRYKDMAGITQTEFAEFRETERTAFPHCFLGECAFSMDALYSFLMEACEVPPRQALAWVCLTQARLIRSNAILGTERAPPWAYGPVALPDDGAWWANPVALDQSEIPFSLLKG